CGSRPRSCAGRSRAQSSSTVAEGIRALPGLRRSGSLHAPSVDGPSMNLPESQKSALLRAASGETPSEEDAFSLGELPLQALPELTAAAAARRDRARGRVLTFSPKVFLPLTNLCRN